MRQEIHWVPKSRRVRIAETFRPARVWTIIGDEKPDLPMVPVHNQNAFLEDFLHDWNFHIFKNANGVQRELRYYSRVAMSEVWILVEYADEPNVEAP